ncbi:MAG TPA: recombinase family protein [Ktedonobacteraceae bacterium]|nr:recombinase family protein [Ktedonobacteraceae bacterium]
MKIGYIRVSKHEQNEALQRDALKEAGCEKYFNDVMTGSKFERKGLEQLLAFARPGDTVIVWKLDRLGRSLKDPIETLNLLKDRGVDFISLTEKIDTTTPGGKLIFHLMGALAEFERDLIRERTNAGLAAARARGRVGGRPKKLSTNGKVALALRLVEDPHHSIDDICSTLGISRSTLYRYVREAKKASGPSDPPA